MKIISQEIAPEKLLDRDLHLYFIYLFIYLFIYFQANDLSLILVLKSGIVFTRNVLDIECIHCTCTVGSVCCYGHQWGALVLIDAFCKCKVTFTV